MSFLVNPYALASGGAGLPTRSLSFASASSQGLSMSATDFGSYNRSKFAISLWTKRASTGSSVILAPFATGQRGFQLAWDGGSLGFFSINASDGSTNGGLTTSATFTNTSHWYHILVWFDVDNPSSGNRMRMWIDGSEITSFSFDTAPTNPVTNSTADYFVGGQSAFGFLNGLIYQLGFFSGTLPVIGDVYNSGSPVDISGLTGLWSYLDCAGNDPTRDGVRAANWTNNNSVTTSTDIP